MPERELKEEFTDRMLLGSRVLTPIKAEFETDFAYYASEQWTKDQKEKLATEDRAALTFNQTFSVINLVAGSETTSRYATKYSPRTVDDGGFSDMLNEMVRYERQQTDAEHEDSTAFEDCSICGMGAIEFRREYSENPVGRTVNEAISMFELIWDHTATKQNITDGKYVVRFRRFSRGDAKSKWPQHKDKIDSLVADYPHDSKTGAEINGYVVEGSLAWYDRDKDEVIIHEYQRVNLEPYFYAVDPATGEGQEFTREEWNRYVSDIEEINAQAVEQSTDIGQPLEPLPIPDAAAFDKRVYRRAYFLGDFELEDGLSPLQEGFTIKFLTGFRYRKRDRTEWFGLMKIMRDPQMWANKMLSQLVYIVSTNPKGAMVAEKGVFKSIAEARLNWAKPNPIIEVRDGALSNGEMKIFEANYPQAQDRIFNMSASAVPQMVGIDAFSIGAQANLSRTSSVTVKTAQQGSLTRLSRLFDSLRLYRKEAGRVYIEMIERYVPEGVLVRVTDPQTKEQQLVPYKKDWVAKVEYDVIVDEAPATVNAMQELWASLQQTQSLELLIQTGVMTPEIVAEIIPGIPESTRADMRKNLQEQNVMRQLIQAVQAGDQETVTGILGQMAQPQQ